MGTVCLVLFTTFLSSPLCMVEDLFFFLFYIAIGNKNKKDLVGSEYCFWGRRGRS